MDKKAARIRRATRARRKLMELGATRLVVHRTPRHIYAQVIAPNGSETLVAASTVEKAISEQVKYTEPRCNCTREQDNTGSENRRNYTRHIHFQR